MEAVEFPNFFTFIVQNIVQNTLKEVQITVIERIFGIEIYKLSAFRVNVVLNQIGSSSNSQFIYFNFLKYCSRHFYRSSNHGN